MRTTKRAGVTLGLRTNRVEAEKWLARGVIDGDTTNPSIVLKDRAYGMEEGARQVCALLGDRPVRVEVTTKDHDEMIRQGRMFASWTPNAAVKIPLVNESGEPSLGGISALIREVTRVSATAIFSFNEAVLAAKAVTTSVNIFAGQVADEGGFPQLLSAMFGNGWTLGTNRRKS